MSKESFVLYGEYEDYFAKLSDADKAALMMAIFAYKNRGEIQQLEGMADAFFMVIRNALDRDEQKYAERCQKNIRNANKRWHTNASDGKQSYANDADNDPDPDPDPDNEPVPDNDPEKASSGFTGGPSPVPAHDGSKLIEEARKLWNSLGAAPAERYTVLQFRPNDLRDCLATVSQFSMAEIREALETYLALLESPDHTVADYPYRSFAAFMRKGVAKFVSSADPWNTTKRKAAPVAAGKAGLVQWPKGGVNAHG